MRTKKKQRNWRKSIRKYTWQELFKMKFDAEQKYKEELSAGVRMLLMAQEKALYEQMTGETIDD